MSKLSKAVGYIREGMKGLIFVAVLSTPLTVPLVAGEWANRTRAERQGYRLKKVSGMRVGDIKTVMQVEESYKYAEPWRAITHYYNPQIIRKAKFEDGSSVTIQYPLFQNCSYLQRKVLGPEPGDRYKLEKSILRKVRE